MADKTGAQKLRLLPGARAVFLDVPAGMRAVLGVPDEVTILDAPQPADFYLVAVGTQSAAEARLSVIAPFVEEDTIAWVAYPKGSKAAGHDVNRDTIAEYATTLGLVAVAAVSIDATWSGIRVRKAR